MLTDNNVITSKDMFYFKAAAQLAEFSTYTKSPTGCVIVYKNKIISTGFNKNKTDPLQRVYNKYRSIPIDSPPKLHAETVAIKQLLDAENIRWNLLSLYIVRLRHITPYGLASPCPSCMQLIKEHGIHHIYYTTNNGYAYEYVE